MKPLASCQCQEDLQAFGFYCVCPCVCMCVCGQWGGGVKGDGDTRAPPIAALLLTPSQRDRGKIPSPANLNT